MTTLTLQPDDSTGFDSYILNKNVSGNYSTSDTIFVGEHNALVNYVYRGLIKFDLSSIPASATITSAVLSLYVYSVATSNTRVLSAYRILPNWVEGQVTWNNYTTGLTWATAGCGNATDREAANIGTVSVTAVPAIDSEWSITLTAAKVQEWIDGTLTNNGVLLQFATEVDDLVGFHSSGSTDAEFRPKLVVEYTAGAGGDSSFMAII